MSPTRNQPAIAVEADSRNGEAAADDTLFSPGIDLVDQAAADVRPQQPVPISIPDRSLADHIAIVCYDLEFSVHVGPPLVCWITIDGAFGKPVRFLGEHRWDAVQSRRRFPTPHHSPMNETSTSVTRAMESRLTFSSTPWMSSDLGP